MTEEDEVDWDSIAEEKIGETAKKRSKLVAKLRDALEDDEDFNPKTEDEFLLRFLRANCLHVKKSVVTVKRYYRMRVTEKDLFTNLLPSEMDQVFASNLVGVLPERDKNGRFIMIIRAGAWNPSKISFVSVFRAILLCFEYMVLSPAAQLCGVSFLCDFEGWGYSTAFSIPASRMGALAGTLSDTYPIQKKRVEIVKQPYSFNVLFKMMTPFIDEKGLKRMHMHGNNLKDLHKRYSKDILPREYGGSKGPYNAAEFYELLKDAEPQFAEDFEFGYNPPE
ncbi:alpha-tocopherol transfer protein-like isoform X1 [Ornithodoros turicata]|uniref:alpha-tocopherol transfer protein-like isoform X1 n=1 Tax=Ornithodoros turicata TaxID=34597 RepID=UPI003139A888